MTATDVFNAAMNLQNSVEGKVFIVFFDHNRNTQIVALFSDPEDGEKINPTEDLQDCLEEITEQIDGGLRPVCLLVGLPGETGELEFVDDIVPLEDKPSLDDLAVIWSLTEEESLREQPQ
jgi:hypothetical protein